VALRKYLKTQLEKRPFLHNRALGLWAESHLKGVFTEEEKKQMVADLFAIQRPDGGWNLGDLGKTKTDQDAPGWEVRKLAPDGAASDGYATGLVVLAMKRTGVAAGDERLKKGIAWLSNKQGADGTWPTAYLNAERNPDDNIGKFMRDAGAAFATLALTESN
jgi:squalene-hopene/tetraprenyl-beta-curcumene cyclase